MFAFPIAVSDCDLHSLVINQLRKTSQLTVTRIGLKMKILFLSIY